MPAVTVFVRPRGEPTAATHSPTLKFLEFPNSMKGNFMFLSSWRREWCEVVDVEDDG